MILIIVEECYYSNLLRIWNEWDFCYGELRDKFIVVFGDVVRKWVWNLLRILCDRYLVVFVFLFGRSVEVGSLENLEVYDVCVGILFLGGIDLMMIVVLVDK